MGSIQEWGCIEVDTVVTIYVTMHAYGAQSLDNMGSIFKSDIFFQISNVDLAAWQPFGSQGYTVPRLDKRGAYAPPRFLRNNYFTSVCPPKIFQVY